MKTVQKVVASSLLLAAMLSFLPPFSALAAVDVGDVKQASCRGSGGGEATRDHGSVKKGDCVGGSGIAKIFRTIANILLFLVGAVAVIMLIIGGLRYVTSGGDQTAVTGAKNTILYAIIGIVVAFLAFAAVNFVTNQLK